jgi:serine/threonine protein kinase
MPEHANFPSPQSLAAPLTHFDALDNGTKLAEFEITSLLGVGGFGMVYSAYDSSLQRTVAIKEYMPSALAGRAGGINVVCRSSADQDALNAGLRSFVAEARLLAQFDHPSLVKVYRFWEANNTAYMVMPLYRGMTLKEARHQMKAPPPESWLRALLWSILGALKYLHENNTVHRDISPDNIFLQDVGPPVLLDLGAARRAINNNSYKHTAILKINYAPIEQYSDAGDMAQGPWTDLYALAAVVHGCLCDAPPVPSTIRAVQDRMPGFASVAKTVQTYFGQHYSAEFIQAFTHALEILPEKRQQSVQEFMDEMKLVAPQGRLPASWRDGLDLLERGLAKVDLMAMTEQQTMRITDVNLPVEAPATDSAPLGYASAYGVLELESPLLVLNDVPEIAAAMPSAAAVGLNSGKTGEPDKTHGPGNPAKNEVASPVATSNPVKPGKRVVAGVLGAALLAGGAYWYVGGRSAAPIPAVVPAQTADAAASSPAGNRIEPAIAVITESAVVPAAPASSVEVSATGTAVKKPAVSTKQAETPTGMNPKGRSAMPHPAQAGKTEPAPTVPVANAATEHAGPEELCASKNFLTRPMCIFQECEKPEFTNLALCVENRRRLKENNEAFNRR